MDPSTKARRNQIVLSIDLDYFVKPTVFDAKLHTKKRPDEQLYKVRNTSSAINFLTTNCKLSIDNPVSGRRYLHHISAFYYIKNLIDRGKLKIPFDLYHLDAHADLGLGSNGYVYLAMDILKRPIEDRSTHIKKGLDALNLGNWLAFCFANRWIENVFVSKQGNSWPFLQFFIDRPDCEKLQLIPIQTSKQLDEYISPRTSIAEFIEKYKSEEPIVNYHYLDEQEFALEQAPDFLVLIKSPQYTPKSADELYEFISRFIKNSKNK